MNLISSILTIYTWAVACILLYFLFAIARFYEKKSGRRSFYLSFFVPIILFAGAAARYILLTPSIAGDIMGDTMRFLGGLTLGGFGFFLLKLMTGGHS